MKEQPFYIGQKVVAIIDGFIKKGSVYTVLRIFWGCHCWFIDIGVVCPIDRIYSCKYCNSKLKLIKGEPFCPDAACFAPVQEGYQAITFEKVLESELSSVN